MSKAKRPVKRAKKPNLKQIAFTRFMFIVAFFFLWIGGISVRLVQLQVSQHDWLSERALGQRRDVKKVKALRGSILDRDGRILAMSIKVKTLYADATEIEDIRATSKKLAKTLKLDEKKLRAQLETGKEAGRRYVPIAKQLDEDVVQRLNRELETLDLRKFDLPKYQGLHWREDQMRTYPSKTLAAQVIGFSNSEDVGQAGIERSFEDQLQGTIIKKVQERDRLGRIYDEMVSEREDPKDIVLTIKHSFQYKTEKALEEAVKASNSRSGMAVVMNVKSGEILAMANYPTFDPNNFRAADPENVKNHVIQSVYAPGSVFKLITYSGAADKEMISPQAMIDRGNGVVKVGNREFKDSHGGGAITYAKSIAISSNVGAIKTALGVGRQDFHGYVKKFGFGTPTGIELPAETGGIVRPVEKWNGDSLASMAIGYEIGVTALQMATSFATIANDGVRVKPRIIKEIRDAEEVEAVKAESEASRVVSSKAAENVRQMLEEVVKSGTGKMAAMADYSSAGKTGTAWKYDEKLKRVNSAKYVSSFIGYAPADDPEIVIAVIMDEPKVGGRNGGQVSAPVFRSIAQGILPELQVEKEKTDVDRNLVAEYIKEDVGMGEELFSNIPSDEIETVGENRSAVIAPTKKKEPPLAKTAETTLKEKSKEPEAKSAKTITVKNAERDKTAEKKKTPADAKERSRTEVKAKVPSAKNSKEKTNKKP